MGAFFGKMEWGTVLTAMVTPFAEDGSVDVAETKRIAAHLVDEEHNDGLVVSGTTGESPTLSSEEKLVVLEAALEAVGDRAAVVFGAGTYNTAESIELTREAERRGAHGIMLVNPYYNKPGQAGLYAHFSTIAGETGLPVMIYNIQPRSAINLETETLARLAEVPNIVAVKEASGSMAQISDVCRLMPEGFRIYSGDDALTLPILSVGGFGVVSVAGHVAGREIKEMVESFRRDPARARHLHHTLTPLFQTLFSEPSPTPVKFAMVALGFRCERLRLPLVSLGEPARERVRGTLRGIGRL